MKKLYIFISLLIGLFILFIYVVFSPKKYVITYNINDIVITEEYQKDNKEYFYTINYNNQDYPLYLNKKYTRKRKHIKSVISVEEENETCLKINLSNEKYYICSKNGTLLAQNVISNRMKEKLELNTVEENVLDTYHGISIYNNELRFFIWNYKGFYQLYDQNTELDKIFDKDNYQNNLTFQTDKYLIFPDYDSDYYFTKLYVYDIRKHFLTSILSDFEISYESFFLGYYKNKVYLVDKKNKFEYEIDLKKEKFNIISKDNTCKIIENNEWKNISLTKVINQEIIFSSKNIYHYYLKDNTLYLDINNYTIKVSNLNIKQIVRMDNNKVYYLSNNKLYSYEYLKEEQLLLKYSEWDFNYSNHIFIFE